MQSYDAGIPQLRSLSTRGVAELDSGIPGPLELPGSTGNFGMISFPNPRSKTDQFTVIRKSEDFSKQWISQPVTHASTDTQEPTRIQDRRSCPGPILSTSPISESSRCIRAQTLQGSLKTSNSAAGQSEDLQHDNLEDPKDTTGNQDDDKEDSVVQPTDSNHTTDVQREDSGLKVPRRGTLSGHLRSVSMPAPVSRTQGVDDSQSCFADLDMLLKALPTRTAYR